MGGSGQVPELAPVLLCDAASRWRGRRLRGCGRLGGGLPGGMGGQWDAAGKGAVPEAWARQVLSSHLWHHLLLPNRGPACWLCGLGSAPSLLPSLFLLSAQVPIFSSSVLEASGVLPLALLACRSRRPHRTWRKAQQLGAVAFICQLLELQPAEAGGECSQEPRKQAGMGDVRPPAGGAHWPPC